MAHHVYPAQIATYKVRTVRVVDEPAVNDSANENVGGTGTARATGGGSSGKCIDSEEVGRTPFHHHPSQ